MSIPERIRNESGAKGCLIVVSIGVGVGLGIFLVRLVFTGATTSEITISSIFGLLAALAWPIIGALVIRLCEALDSWANLGEEKEWQGGVRLLLGALWPLTLVSSLIVFTFLGIIHRLF